jgi:hypothetical protein
MNQVDIFGQGIKATITGVLSGKDYEGLLLKKTDPIPQNVPSGYILIDVDEIKNEHVVTSHYIERFDAQKINSLKGDYYMVVENRPLFSQIQPFEDLRGS